MGDPAIILENVLSFLSLLSASPLSAMSISPQLWPTDAHISYAENLELLTPLSKAEIDEVVATSKSNSTPGRDGFSMSFFKKFWPVMKFLVYAIIQGLGTIDIFRLNYAVISLVPKVKGADSIRQFSAIVSINNIVKFPSKGFDSHLSSVAHRVIG